MRTILFIVAASLSISSCASSNQVSDVVETVFKDDRPYTAEEHGLMQGPHGPGVKTVTKFNWNRAPYNRWSLQNMQAIKSTAPIYRAGTPATPLPKSDKSIAGLFITDQRGTNRTFDEVMTSTYTDGFLVVHKGEVVHEQYWNGMKPWTRHLLFSVSKSYTGMIAGILADEGRLDMTFQLTQYIPELKDTAWENTTVQELIDMNTAVDWDETGAAYNVTGIKNIFFKWAVANGSIPYEESYGEVPDGNHDFLASLPKKPSNKGAFHYKSVDTDMAGWVIEAASGQSFAELMTEKLWSQIGMEYDANIAVNKYGSPGTNYGLSIALGDMGRMGMVLAAGGKLGDQQIIPKAFWDDIADGGDKQLWKNGGYDQTIWENGSYRNFFWHRGNDRSNFYGVGIHGQFMYIDPGSNTAIIRFASQPIGWDPESNSLIFAVFDEIVRRMETE